MYDFSREVIERLQLVHSHEIEQLQLADLLIGAIGYLNRGLQGNAGKMALIRADATAIRIHFDKNNTVERRKGQSLSLARSGGSGMSEAPDWLPPLVLFNDFGGDWDAYLEAIYAWFKRDFIDSKPCVSGTTAGPETASPH